MGNVHVPPDLWDAKPEAGKFLVFMDSQLSSIALTVHPSRPLDDRILVVGGDVWLRATLRMIGWAVSRNDLMLELGNAGKITQAQFDDFGARMDTLWAWVSDSESYSKEDLGFAWDQRAAQRNFKPPFDHYRKKYVVGQGKKETT